MLKYLGFVSKNYFSRYYVDRAINNGENLYYEFHNEVDIKSLDYITFKVDSKDHTLPAIAYKYYNNQLYWWILAYANDIIDPSKSLEIGSTIKVPRILDVINQYNQKVSG